MDTPPLPPYHLTFSASRFYPDKVDYETFVFTWGDLKITARRAIFEIKTKTLSATGDILVERGDEQITADSLQIQGLDLLSAKRDLSQLALEAKKAQLSSPPFFLEGAVLAFRNETGGEGQRLRFVPGTGGKGELAITAERIFALPGSNRLAFRNATVHLYGTRLLTLRRLTLNPSSTTKSQGLNLTMPITFRSSRLSGAILGLRVPFAPVGGVKAVTLVESSSRQGIGTLFMVQKELLARGKRDEQPSLLSSLSTNTSSESERLRAIITARKPPAYSLATLGWRDLLATPSTVPDADTSTDPQLRLEATLQNNREIVRRDAQLLLGRQPEVRLVGRLPARSGALVAEVGVGRFVETRFDQGRTGVREDRLLTLLGVEAPPLHFGKTGRLRLNLTSTQQNYQDSTYRIHEARFASDYSFTEHTGIGAGLILRDVSGASPLLFDTVEAQNEGQLRGQTQFGPYLLGAVGRWDLKTNTLFDSEISLSLRGKTIEPRLYWRRQNQQFSFSVVFPALTGS